MGKSGVYILVIPFLLIELCVFGALACIINLSMLLNTWNNSISTADIFSVSLLFFSVSLLSFIKKIAVVVPICMLGFMVIPFQLIPIFKIGTAIVVTIVSLVMYMIFVRETVRWNI